MEKTSIQSGISIPLRCPNNAWTNYLNHACNWALTEEIIFSEPFSSPPTITVYASSLWTDYTPCLLKTKGPSGDYESGMAMDAQLAFAEKVTNFKFSLRGGSSPVDSNSMCPNSVNYYWVPNKIHWIAVGLK